MRNNRPAVQRFGGLAAMGVVCMLLAAAPAAAQGSGEFDSYRIPGWSFTPSLALGAIYDTNVALTSPRADQRRTQGDTLFSLMPAGQLELIRPRTDFSIAYRGFLRRYMDVDGLNSFDQRGEMSLTHMVTRRLTLSARDNFVDNSQP